MLRGVKLGRKGLHITIRQFFDDTLVFLQPTLESVMMLKGVLRCFEVAIGLKVNFHKSQLIGLVFQQGVIQRFASLLIYMTAGLLFTYLGVLIGVNHQKEIVWRSVLEKLRRRMPP